MYMYMYMYTCIYTCMYMYMYVYIVYVHCIYCIVLNFRGSLILRNKTVSE